MKTRNVAQVTIVNISFTCIILSYSVYGRELFYHQFNKFQPFTVEKRVFVSTNLSDVNPTIVYLKMHEFEHMSMPFIIHSVCPYPLNAL